HDMLWKKWLYRADRPEQLPQRRRVLVEGRAAGQAEEDGGALVRFDARHASPGAMRTKSSAGQGGRELLHALPYPLGLPVAQQPGDRGLVQRAEDHVRVEFRVQAGPGGSEQ